MSIRHRVNIFRRYPHWAMKECIFIHIPKVAGTSINEAIYGRTLGHYSAQTIKARFPRLYERCFVFSFVRNPWDRAVSAYRFAKKGRTETMGVRNPSQYQIPEFESFERFVIEWLSCRDTSQLDYIFQPQHHFVTDRHGVVMVDFLGRFENLDSDIAVVNERLGREIVLPRINVTCRSPGYVSEYKSQELIDLVGEIYQEDIHMFKYEF